MIPTCELSDMDCFKAWLRTLSDEELEALRQELLGKMTLLENTEQTQDLNPIESQNKTELESHQEEAQA